MAVQREGNTRGREGSRAAGPSAAPPRPAPGARADDAAGGRRLPRAAQARVVEDRADGHARAQAAGDRRRDDARHPADDRVARPPARPVPAPRRRGRRHPPVARLQPDVGPRASGGPGQRDRQAQARRQALAVLRRRHRARRDGVPRRGRGPVLPPRPARRPAADDQRRLRRHPDLEHAARARAPRLRRRRLPPARRADAGGRDLRRAPARDGASGAAATRCTSTTRGSGAA